LRLSLTPNRQVVEKEKPGSSYELPGLGAFT